MKYIASIILFLLFILSCKNTSVLPSTTVTNNLIYNTKGDKTPVVAHDKLDGILFKSNVINNQGVDFDAMDGIKTASFDLKEIVDYIWAPTTGFPEEEVYHGFGFEEFNKDLFGSSREKNNTIGALVGQPTSAPPILDRSQYGTDWYKIDAGAKEPTTHKVKNGKGLAIIIAEANDGDIIELLEGNYNISSSLKIDKSLVIGAASSAKKVVVNYTGASKSPLFEMNPKGELSLKGIHLRGNNSQYAFASLKDNMSSLYNLTVDNCEIEKFDYVLKAYKYSFSEDIIFRNSIVRNCNNGLELSEEIEDKGEYNAENIKIDACTFDGVGANVVDYYRGGYDESTVGGNLSITNSTFNNCGAKEQNGILLNTYGIINVDISGNTFQNNKVRQVAQLWGAKNNSHKDNKITNSGKIVVEENLKLKLLY